MERYADRRVVTQHKLQFHPAPEITAADEGGELLVARCWALGVCLQSHLKSGRGDHTVCRSQVLYRQVVVDANPGAAPQAWPVQIVVTYCTGSAYIDTSTRCLDALQIHSDIV